MEDEIMETWDKVGNNVEGKTDFLFDGLSWSLEKVIMTSSKWHHQDFIFMTSSLRHHNAIITSSLRNYYVIITSLDFYFYDVIKHSLPKITSSLLYDFI